MSAKATKTVRVIMIVFGCFLMISSLIWSHGTKEASVNLGAVSDHMVGPVSENSTVIQPINCNIKRLTSLKVLGADATGSNTVILRMRLLSGNECIAETEAELTCDERQLNIPFSFGKAVNNDGSLTIEFTVAGQGSVLLCGAVRECPSALLNGERQDYGVGIAIAGSNDAFSYAALYLGLMMIVISLVPIRRKEEAE